MFRPKCQSINYNQVNTTLQLLDRTVSLNDKNEISTLQEQKEFENHQHWVYYGQKRKMVHLLLYI